METGLLLIAHGSRRDEANADLEFVAQELLKRGRFSIIECCFLELAEPDIETAGARCVVRGAGRVLMTPFFLSAGIHVTKDLEEARRSLSIRHPGVEFRLCEPMGRHPLIVEIISQRAEEGNAAGGS